MAYKIIPTKTFERSLKKCDKDVAQRLMRELSVLEYDRSGVIKMRYTPKHLKGLHKYRIGEWRVLLWLDKRSKTITLYRVGHRREIYRSI